MIFTNFLYLLSVFVLLTACNGAIHPPQNGGSNLVPHVADVGGCGKPNDPMVYPQNKFCEWYVYLITDTSVEMNSGAKGVAGYIPDCAYLHNKKEGELKRPEPENRNYDFEIANNTKTVEVFRVLQGHEKIQQGKIYRFTKVGVPAMERGVRMLEEIEHLGEGDTKVKCMKG